MRMILAMTVFCWGVVMFFIGPRPATKALNRVVRQTLSRTKGTRPTRSLSRMARIQAMSPARVMMIL